MTYVIDLFCVFVRILIVSRENVVRVCELHSVDASCKICFLTVLFKLNKGSSCFDFTLLHSLFYCRKMLNQYVLWNYCPSSEIFFEIPYFSNSSGMLMIGLVLVNVIIVVHTLGNTQHSATCLYVNT